MRSPPPAAAARARPPACFTVLHHFRTKVSVDAPFSKRDDVAVGVAKKLDARACGAACDAATTASIHHVQRVKEERACVAAAAANPSLRGLLSAPPPQLLLLLLWRQPES